MKAPVRAWFVITPALNGSDTVHVHVIFVDIPFSIPERFSVISVRRSSLSDRLRTEIASQRNPLAEEPEAPSRAVACRHRRHLMAVPVERLVVLPPLVEPSPLPVVLTGPGLVGPRLVGSAGRRVRRTASSGLRGGQACPESEYTCETESSGNNGCTDRLFEIHCLSFLFVRRRSPAPTLRTQYWSHPWLD
jgi:hypothetical protein